MTNYLKSKYRKESLSLDKINDINLKGYSNKKIARLYSNEESLQKTEEVILNNIKEEVRNKKILDIGVGGGKTTKYLMEISGDYTAIDYSQEMVNECKKRFPQINVFCCDAKNMSIFKNCEFDFILFTYNGIDYVSHNGRLLILQEIFRVLKKGGYFVFSSHNKDSAAFERYISPFSPLFTHNPLAPFTFNPLEVITRSISFLKGIFNHLKRSKYVIQTDEYSIINDKAHEYSLMTYYVTINHQKEQLYNIGFERPIKIYDRYGEQVIGDSKDTWIYYLVKK